MKVLICTWTVFRLANREMAATALRALYDKLLGQYHASTMS